MSCGCDGNNPNVNRFLCDDPCRVTAHNTPACESLPSQIQNFSDQFFGAVVKTEIDGAVTWSLPCSLDVGLPNNPRSVDEGLACYFLRLFSDGIIGLTGPAGPAGTNGVNGNNAYSVTKHGFTQPSLGNPNVQVTTFFNPAIVAGTYVFIQDSGWYLVNATDTTGVLFLQLVQAISSVSGTVNAGKLVLISGPPGPSTVGPTGASGPQGPAGTPGELVTLDNAYYFATVGTDFTLGVTYAPVDFVNSAPQLLLQKAGKHLVTVVATVAGLGGVATSDAVLLKLKNTTTSIDAPGTEQVISNLVPNQFTQLSITALVTTSSDNNTLALYGRASGAGIIDVVALNTNLTVVRIQ
jgi:hypothetical protein